MQYRRFGRTNLKIPVLSLGGMRFQKSWDQLDFSEVSYQEQNKVENILDLATQYGLSHVETAKYYGTSEVQLGMCFKNTKKIPNIIQTKIPPNSDPEIFERDVLSSIEKLKVKKIDLLAIHGINTAEHLHQGYSRWRLHRYFEEFSKRKFNWIYWIFNSWKIFTY